MLNKIIFTLSVLILGWFLRDVIEPQKNKEITQKQELSTFLSPISSKSTEKFQTKISQKTDTKKETPKGFYDLLALYLDAQEETEKLYLQKIEHYVEALTQTNPSKALEYLSVLLEEAPQSKALKLLIETHIAQKNFTDAIFYLKQEKEAYLSDKRDLEIVIQINHLAKIYINTKKAPSSKRIAFLEEMIDFDSSEPFYTFSLAKELYLNNPTLAIELFESIEDDNNYSKRIRNYLHPNQKYDYAIGLTKYGKHYIANIYLDNVLCRLMLDTGASYILLDRDKGSFLPPIENIKLHTASNTIDGQVAVVKKLQIEEVLLFNIKVTLAPFKREKIDGLLGMNFFEKFDFHIDQQKNILYLNPK